MNNPTWLEEAARLPLAFAVVREDALLDVEVVAGLPAGARVVMIASGGCTAAALARLPNVARLHLVDPNPAQLALARLKAHLAVNVSPLTRSRLLGHAHCDPEQRRQILGRWCEKLGLSLDVLGPAALLAEEGPDHAGRYEKLFARLRLVLRPHEAELHALLELTDPTEQAARVRPGTPLGDALDAAYDDVLALPHLVRLFGEGATQNPVEPFARHFARRTRLTLASLPAATNPYLWLMLRGRLPDVRIPWLDAPTPDVRPLPSLVVSRAVMTEVLAGEKESYDLVHLSNILDWLSPAEASRTLELAWQALRPAGVVFIRQLNSTLDIPTLGPMFRWDTQRGEELLRRDRSFFYRHLHLGIRP